MPHAKPNAGTRPTQIIIVGAGVFGLATASELSRRGYQHVTVLDRALPPVPDGSSVDISRIIRCDYADPFYAKLGREAMDAWNSPEWEPFYHCSGLAVAGQTKGDPTVEQCKVVLRGLGQSFVPFENSEELYQLYPALKGGLQQASGYVNRACGWADAQGAIRHLASQCSHLGVSFLTGAHGTVTQLLTKEGRVVGVSTLAGPLYGSRVILATGAWTNRLVDLTAGLSSSAHAIGFVQLSAAEAAQLADMPVIIDFSTGFFIFPPTPDTHVLKLARHGHGFETQIKATGRDQVISGPRLSVGPKSTFIPEDADVALSDALRNFLPRIADKPWSRTRLCWYTDTPRGDFVVDHHPNIENLFIATGGAGQ